MTAGQLCRLEYLTPDGWQVGHAGMRLLDPARYVERLAEKRKFGRATVLNADLSPTDEVYVADSLPDPGRLVPSATDIPQLGCDFCGDAHTTGRCLL